MYHALTCLEGNSDHVLVGHSYFAILLLLLLVFFSLCSPSCPGTSSVDQAGLKLT